MRRNDDTARNQAIQLFRDTFGVACEIPLSVQRMIDISIDLTRFMQDDYARDYKSKDIIPLLNILDKLRAPFDISIETNGFSVCLTRGMKNILIECLEMWIDDMIKPLSIHSIDGFEMAISTFKQYLDKVPAAKENKSGFVDWCNIKKGTCVKELGEQEDVDFYCHWREKGDEVKQFFLHLYDCHEDGTLSQRNGRFLWGWYNAIPWEKTHRKYEKMIFLYHIGLIFGLYPVSGCLTNKQMASKAAYDIEEFKKIDKNSN